MVKIIVNSSARFVNACAVKPLNAINSPALAVVSPRFQAKVSRFTVHRSIIGSSIAAAPPVTPMIASPANI